MNATKKLMTAVTTSLMLGGPAFLPASAVNAYGQTASQPDDSWKTDPQVQQAADDILATFSCPSVPKTEEAILKELSQYNAPLIEKALKKLTTYTGDLKRNGDGSKDKPYTYTLASSCTG